MDMARLSTLSRELSIVRNIVCGTRECSRQTQPVSATLWITEQLATLPRDSKGGAHGFRPLDALAGTIPDSPHDG